MIGLQLLCFELGVLSHGVTCDIHSKHIHHFLQLLTAEDSDADIHAYWEKTTRERFPLLRRLVRALLALPHGNADPERLFSCLPNCTTKTRKLLGPLSLEAILVTKSYLLSHDLVCHTFPVTDRLMQLVASSRAEYENHKRQKLVAKEEAARQERERQLRQTLRQEMERSHKMKTLCEEATSVNFN